MELLKILLILIFCIYLYYRIGVLLKKIINSKSNNIGETLLYGVIANFAIFELINIPFILFFKHSTKILYILFLIMNLIFIILSYIVKIKTTNYNIINNIKKLKIIKSKKEIVFLAISVILIIFQIYQSAFLFKEDADDAFYISWANEAKELEDFYDKDPSVSIEESTFDVKYIFNVWEIYGGFIARLFNINVTILFHTIYPIVYMTLAYIAYYLVLKKTIKKENLALAIGIMTIVFLFTGVSTKFKGPFLLGRIYQGKSILLNIIIPFVIANFINYKEFIKEKLIILSITYIAALAFSPMTVSLLSILYGLFLIIIFLKKDKKELKKIALIMLLVIIICIFYMIKVGIGNKSLENVTNPQQFNQIEDLKAFVGEGKPIFILYFISIFIIAIKGSKEQKNLGVILPVLLAILVLNPLLTGVYIKLVTSGTYWRLYWLLPMEITITISATIIYDIIKAEKMKYAFLVFITVLLAISGKYVYTNKRGFSEFQNFEKIPNYIIDETYFISSKVQQKTKVVAPPEPWEACMMRQYSTRIILMHSRNAYAFENEYRRNFLNLYETIYIDNREKYDINILNKLEEEYEVEWIILPKNKLLEDKEGKLKYTIMTENEKNYILKEN